MRLAVLLLVIACPLAACGDPVGPQTDGSLERCREVGQWMYLEANGVVVDSIWVITEMCVKRRTYLLP
jgi:hypothetical protein